MIKILNTWRSDQNTKVWFDVAENQNVYQHGDFAIFKMPRSYLYCYKQIAINELFGLNSVYLSYLANFRKPKSNMKHIFERAVKALQKGISLTPAKNLNSVAMELLSEKKSVPSLNGFCLVDNYYYKCVETGERFTTEDLDTLNLLIRCLVND